MLRYSLTLLALLWAINLHAKEQPYIEVIAQGSASLILNRAEVRFDFSKTNTNLTQATQEVEKQHANVRQILANLGIPEHSIDDSSISIQPQYNYENGNSQFIGMRYSRATRISDLELSNVNRVVDALVSTGVRNLSEPRLYSNSSGNASDAALAAAVTQGIHKAERIAAAAKAKLGDIIFIQEQQDFPQIETYARSASIAEQLSDSVAPIQPGTSTVYSTVLLRVALQP